MVETVTVRGTTDRLITLVQFSLFTIYTADRLIARRQVIQQSV
jgi:hypothetical protein